jgi:hypothetical protein
MWATGGISAVKCYDGGTTTKALADAMKRVETWPYEAQEELAGIALEMDAAAKGGAYQSNGRSTGCSAGSLPLQNLLSGDTGRSGNSPTV